MHNFAKEYNQLYWEQEIQSAKERLHKIQQEDDANNLLSLSPKLKSEAISELSHAIEELQVALEELQQQNQELLSTRTQVEQERQRYVELFDFAPDGYVITNKYGVIQEANTIAITMLNLSKKHLIRKPLDIFVAPKDRQNFRHERLKFLEYFRQNIGSNSASLKENQLKNWEISLQPRQGKPFPVLLSVCATSDPNNKSITILWLLRDLTQTKQAEEKIRQQAALLDVATDAIIVRDLNLQILFWNRGAERLYGWKAEEALGKNYCELLQEETQLEDALKKVIEKGEWRGELNKINKSGQNILVESHWTLVRDEASHPKSIFSVDTDITQKKRLEEKAFQSQCLEGISTLASGLAHDLNNILNPVFGAAQLLSSKLSDTKDEQIKQLLQILQTNTERAAAMVKRMLSFRDGEVELPHNSAVQVRDLLEEIEQTIKETFPKSIEICCETPLNLSLVYADNTQVYQVLMNLVVNARDAMPDGGILRLSAANIFIDENFVQSNSDARVGNYIVIIVSDTGTGISPENLNRIFDLFFTTKEVGQGTGLGLATVVTIVKNYDGFVRVSSEVGKGTEFQVFLPATDLRGLETVDHAL